MTVTFPPAASPAALPAATFPAHPENGTTLLVTGGAGFIGSNFCRYVLAKYPDCRVIVLDALTYAGNLSTLADIQADPNNAGRFRFYPGEIQNANVVEGLLRAERIDAIVNFAAESHNDRSLLEPGRFIQTDVYGVWVLLDAVKRHCIERMLHVSTDEVYGTIDNGQFTEESPIQPNTPYAASKAGGEMQARAHWIAYQTPIIVTRCGNNFGPWQYPEKLIPFFITRLLDHKKVPIYGNGQQVRDWVSVSDHCSGIDHALRYGTSGQAYNIGGVSRPVAASPSAPQISGVPPSPQGGLNASTEGNDTDGLPPGVGSGERTNLDVTHRLLSLTQRPNDLIKFIHDPRGGAHDRRYSINADKLYALGWRPEQPFDAALEQTVAWYRDHQTWWRDITATAEYQTFLHRFYAPYLGDDL